MVDQIDYKITGKYNGFTFIFMVGEGTYFEYYNYTNYNTKNNFLTNLSKISQLFIYDPLEYVISNMYHSRSFPMKYHDITNRTMYYPSNDKLSCESHCKILHQLLKKLKIKPPYIILAHSLGGFYAMTFAKLYPKLVKHIFLINPAIHTLDVKNLLQKSAHKLEEMQINKYIEYVLNNLTTTDPKILGILKKLNNNTLYFIVKSWNEIPDKVHCGITLFNNTDYEGKKKLAYDVKLDKEQRNNMIEYDKILYKNNSDYTYYDFSDRFQYSTMTDDKKLLGIIKLTCKRVMHKGTRNIIPSIDISQIKNYIQKHNLNVSYSISSHGIIHNQASTAIYPMHSISKLFTMFLLILLVDNKILMERNLVMPIKLDHNVTKLLPLTVQKRLKEMSLFDCLMHKSGLYDYERRYIMSIRNCLKDGALLPNPLEPEDFLMFADDKVGKYNEFHYSHLGYIMIALCIKYYYNKKQGTNLSYNDILHKYIINKIKLKSFSITRPEKSKLNTYIDVSKYINGSPAYGYWLSCNDVRIFGEWISLHYNQNERIRNLFQIYCQGVYVNDVIEYIRSLSLAACLHIYLYNRIVMVVCSEDSDDSLELHNVINNQ